MPNTLKQLTIKHLGVKNFERLRTVADYFFDFSKKTYSQFGEDLILRRIFENKANGFFVDIGAFHPRQHSNTYWLYKKGWHGINVDPTPGRMKLFQRLRPKDINLEIAISQTEGNIKFYSWGMNPGNTCVYDQTNAMKNDFGEPLNIIDVQATTLSTLFSQHIQPSTLIDLLNIDVEGMDLDVLRSNDWNTWKPYVVLVELFANDLGEILDSDIHRFMLSKNYMLTYILNPTLIYLAHA